MDKSGKRLGESQATGYLGLPTNVLRNMRHAGKAPKHIVVNGRAYYDKTDLDQYIESVSVEPMGAALCANTDS